MTTDRYFSRAWMVLLLGAACGGGGGDNSEAGTTGGGSSSGGAGVSSSGDEQVTTGDIASSTSDEPGTGSSSSGGDEGPVPPEAYERWLKVELPGTVCGNNSQYKFFVNYKEGAKDLMMMLEPGGACWDYDGCFAVQLSSAQRDGQTLSVVQTDVAGNVSPPLALTALDTTAPTGLTASVDGTGTIVSGQAEAGASITVRDPDGAIIGTGTASVTGAYALNLTPAQLNGQLLQVTQTDVAGNTSPPSPAAAPDLTAPDAPFFTLDGTGANATGSGEVGATVTLRDADGTVIGNGQVGADGSFQNANGHQHHTDVNDIAAIATAITSH